MVLAVHHAAEAREVGLGLIGVRFFGRIGLGMVDAADDREAVVQGIPMGGLIGIDRGVGRDVLDRQGDALGLTLGHEGLGGALALAEDHDDATLAVLVFGLAAILAALDLVGGADLPAEIGAVHLDLTGELHPLDFGGQGLTELVGEHPSRLVLTIDVPAELEGGEALHGVHTEDDGGAQVGEGHLAAGEDGARGDGKLVGAAGALELAAVLHVVVLEPAAAGAHGSAFGLSPTHPAERAVSRVFAALVDGGQREGAGFGGEEEVLRHVITCDAYAPFMMAF